MSIERYEWLWNATYDTEQRNKIIIAAAQAKDIEALKWLWSKTYDTAQRNMIIGGAARTEDVEALKWFWNATYDTAQRNKLIDGMLPSQISTNPKIVPSITVPKSTNQVCVTKLGYDLFICHASEDKVPFVRDLATELSSIGLGVWYDEFSLSIGDSLRRSIDYGLAHSRYGVVVLSQSFFKKEWPQKELDGLVARERDANKVILPIWHGVTEAQVRNFSPILAGRVAASSSKGLEYVVNEIVRVVKQEPK